LIQITHAGPFIQDEQLQNGRDVGVVTGDVKKEFAAAGVLQQIGTRFGHDDRDPFAQRIVEIHIAG
jgi:hypothetical protein